MDSSPGREPTFPSRPTEAAFLFARAFIMEIKDGDQTRAFDAERVEDYVDTPWFKAVARTAREWYDARYGQAAEPPDSPGLRSIAIIYEAFFELSIPTTLTQPGRPDQTTVGLVFPSDVRPEESPLSFIVAPPNLDAMTPRAQLRTERTIRRIARTVRCIDINLMEASWPSEEARGLSRSVDRHMDQAVTAFLDRHGHHLGDALAHIHMSVEKALKALLAQRGLELRTHDLPSLLERVNTERRADLTLPRAMPTWQEINGFRYGAPPSMGRVDALRLYYRALGFLAQATNLLDRNIRLADVEFQIARAPWL